MLDDDTSRALLHPRRLLEAKRYWAGGGGKPLRKETFK